MRRPLRRSLLLGLATLPLLAGCALFDDRLEEAPLHVVYFPIDGATLDSAAQGTIANAAKVANRHPAAPVAVLGYAGPVGGAAFNQQLSAERAEAVAAALRQGGVAPGRISIQPRGEVAYELMPIESRRVEIRIGEAQIKR